MRHLFRITLICSAALSMAGCSGGSSVDTTTYCGKAAVMACANMFSCCTSEQRETVLGEENVNDESKCQKDLAVSCEIGLAQAYYGIEKGTVEYDDTLATKCIDAMKRPEGECAVVAEVAPYAEACKESPFKGKVAPGNACNWNLECQKGSTCSGGVCKAPPAEGENCTLTCQEGLYCKAGKCAQQLGSGEVCTTTSECQSNLYCDKATTTATEKKCLALKAVGEVCTGDSQCDTDDCGAGKCSSDGSSCTSDWDCDGVCEKEGTSCSTDWDCLKSYCEKSGTVCTSDAQCDTATSEQCIDDTCGDATCEERKCAAKPLAVYDYCKAVL